MLAEINNDYGFMKEIYDSSYSIGQSLADTISLIVLVSFLLFIIFIIIIRWIFRIDTIVRRLTGIKNELSELNQTNKDLRIYIDKIEQNTNKGELCEKE